MKNGMDRLRPYIAPKPDMKIAAEVRDAGISAPDGRFTIVSL